MWLYHSHTDEVADTYAGLIGALVITKKGAAKKDGMPADVDSEVCTLFQGNDENSRCALRCSSPELQGPQCMSICRSSCMSRCACPRRASWRYEQPCGTRAIRSCPPRQHMCITCEASSP